MYPGHLMVVNPEPIVGLEVVFFFQAEDGIRYTSVTGVQTCALPISGKDVVAQNDRRRGAIPGRRRAERAAKTKPRPARQSEVPRNHGWRRLSALSADARQPNRSARRPARLRRGDGAA